MIKKLWTKLKAVLSYCANIPKKNKKQPIYYRTNWPTVRQLQKNQHHLSHKPVYAHKKRRELKK